VNVQPEEFASWLVINERRTSDQFNRAEMDLVSSLNRRTQFFGAGDAFHVFPVTPDLSSREDSENSTERPHKRPRIAEKDKPPCLRCRILKKKVIRSNLSSVLGLSTYLLILHQPDSESHNMFKI
jgi:hypothetical protein